jgi:apolipoprotein D and lipocalin family protein
MKARTFAIAAAAVAAVVLGANVAAPARSTDLTTVSAVDLNRYLGTWYEIARYPNRFQKQCVGDTTASYSLREGGGINVVNRCRTKGGKIDEAKGRAKIVDQQSKAKLKVTFFWPFYGDYWIIGLDRDYRYAVVSDPNRKYLWILSRTPKMDPNLYDEAIRTIREKGLDPAKLITTPQYGTVPSAS